MLLACIIALNETKTENNILCSTSFHLPDALPVTALPSRPLGAFHRLATGVCVWVHFVISDLSDPSLTRFGGARRAHTLFSHIFRC